MVRENLVDLLYSRYLSRRKYIENLMAYLSRVREICRSVDPDCRTILFGSYARGTARPDSDVDILLVSKLAGDPWTRAKIFVKILEGLDPEHPFEIHIVTPEEYEKWYKKFIDVYVEV